MSSSPSVVDQVAGMLEDIAARCTADAHQPFLLMDGARFLHLSKADRPQLDVQQAVSPLGLNADHPVHAVGPLLLEVTLGEWTTPRRLRQLTCLLEEQVCSMVVTPLASPALSEMLSKYTDVDLSDGTGMLMRFFDPRVLPFWFDIVPADHRAALAGALRAWAYFDHRRQLAWLPLGEPRNDAGAAASPLTLNGKQEELLLRQCLPYTLLDKLLEDPESRIGEVPIGQRYDQLDALIGKAQAHGFDGMTDLEDICRLGLRYGLGFDERGPMKWALGRRVPTQHLRDILAAFSEADWKEMQT